ncbi:MAG: universal stress protein [Proteobacteria bacterium]|nr:universal stress protein [Pseudomonadota bacterium]
MAAPKPTTYRRIVLQIDSSSHCRDTLRTATDIAALLGAELKGVFVEDHNVLSVGKLDFVREVSLSSRGARAIDSPTLETQLKAMARSARRQLQEIAKRRQVNLDFQTIRDAVDAEFRDMVAQSDLLITESTGRSHGRFPSSAQLTDQLPQISNRPTLYLKGGQSLASCFVLLCESAASADKMFPVALSLTNENEQELLFVPCIKNKFDMELLEKHLVDLADAYEGDAQVISPLPQNSDDILNWLGAKRCLLVMDSEGSLLQTPRARNALAMSRFPLLIV